MSFDYPQKNVFENPYFRNPQVNFVTEIRTLRLVENTVIGSTEVLRATYLSLNGFSLTTSGDVNVTNLSAADGSLICNDLTIPTLTFENTRVTVNGDCQINEKLVMTHENDYLLVKGDLTMILSGNDSESLTAGTVFRVPDGGNRRGKRRFYRKWQLLWYLLSLLGKRHASNRLFGQCHSNREL